MDGREVGNSKDEKQNGFSPHLALSINRENRQTFASQNNDLEGHGSPNEAQNQSARNSNQKRPPQIVETKMHLADAYGVNEFIRGDFIRGDIDSAGSAINCN